MGWFNSNKPPVFLKIRSHPSFIVATVAIGLFTDLFLYGLVVPVLPSLLHDRIHTPPQKIQSYVSGLLAAYSGASVLFSVPAGWVADRTSSRQLPFLAGLATLLAATIMLAVGRSIAVLVIARILQGMSAAVVWTVGLAMVLDTVGPSDLGKVIGSIFSFISVGELLAPPLGGALFDKTGYIGVFGLSAGVLAIDFLLRALVVERKVAARYDSEGTIPSNPRDHASRGDENAEDSEDSNDDSEDVGEPDEESSLLRRKEKKNAEFKVKDPENQNRLITALPFLYCLRNPRLLIALLLFCVQATIVGSFDATIPTEAQELFGFSSLQSGLVFIALITPYLVLGPIAGWIVDKRGTKLVAVVGFTYLVPTLILLRLSSDHVVTGQKDSIILYCGLLAINGVGLALIGSPSVVEASDIVQRYDKANPGFFGENGPYAQLYGFNSLAFCCGLTIGPVLAGSLTDHIGYGNMNLVLAVISAITAALSFFYIGGKPSILKKSRR